MTEFFAKYDTGEFYDEMFAAPGQARPHYQRLLQRFTELTEGEFDRKRDLAALTLLRQGVTFTVYSDAQGTERIFPFDLIPRIISGEEWKKIERGLEQRITALNLFLNLVPFLEQEREVANEVTLLLSLADGAHDDTHAFGNGEFTKNPF